MVYCTITEADAAMCAGVRIITTIGGKTETVSGELQAANVVIRGPGGEEYVLTSFANKYVLRTDGVAVPVQDDRKLAHTSQALWDRAIGEAISFMASWVRQDEPGPWHLAIQGLGLH